MEGNAPALAADPPKQDWRRAVALFAVVFAMPSVARPSVLIAVPFLLLLGMKRLRTASAIVACGLALLIVIGGARDGIWYFERGWAVLIGGWFVAVSMARPAMQLSGRLLAAVMGATASAASILAVRSGAWSVIDWAVTDRVQAAVAAVVDAAVLFRGGETLSPLLVAVVYQTADWQVSLFPAFTAITSMGALAAAWWATGAFSASDGRTIGPIRDYRFNDHLVWVFVIGLVLMVVRGGEPLQRVGFNAVAFMGALYALRGAAVVVFVSGGLSFLAYLLTTVVFVVAPAVVLGGAMVVGIGDTYLDFRKRVTELTA